MLRFSTIIVFLLTSSHLADGQAFGDFLDLSNNLERHNEKTILQFIQAARDDADSTKVVVSMGLYGKYLTQQQRYPEAEAQLDRALKIIHDPKVKSHLRKNVSMTALSIYDVYDYLGEYYTQTANYGNAEVFLKESERIRSKEFPRGSVFRIFNIQKLAQFYLDSEQDDLARIYLEKLIRELNRTRFNSEKLKFAYGVYYKGMTELSIRKGNLADAEKFLRKTIIFYGGPFQSYQGAMQRQLGNPETMLLRSRVLMMKGNTDEALQILENGILRGPDSLEVLPKLLRNKVICLFENGNTDAALRASSQLLELNLANLNRAFDALSENEKEEFNKHVSFDFNLVNSLVINNSSANALDPNTLATLINFRLRSKALLLNNSRKIRQTIYDSRDSSLIKNYGQLLQLRNQASLEVFRKRSKEKMGKVNEEIERLEKLVSHRVAAITREINKPATIADIQSRLKADECAIEIIETKNFRKTKKDNVSMFSFSDSTSYLAAIILKDGIDYSIINNGYELENRMTRYFKNSVIVVGNDSILYSAFWNPFVTKLGGRHSIYFSPDGAYNLINLNLLKNGKGYLLDQYQITLLSSLKDMIGEKESQLNKTAVFVGHPMYELGKSTLDSLNSTTQRTATRALRAASLEELKTADFEDLPGTEDEVVQGTAILKANGWRVEKITGADAVESAVKHVDSPSILHLATHGFFIQEGGGINPMLRSGLIFSGVKNQDALLNEDGVLTAYEASGLKLDNTKLVILSACETGTGELTNGEGVYGLQRAFMIAGADNIIMSLWKVDDVATQKLMSHFYTALARSGNVRSAFTEAQRKLRDEYPEPVYWGAFVLLGL
jgi:CHAT domain-containing protein